MGSAPKVTLEPFECSCEHSDLSEGSTMAAHRPRPCQPRNKVSCDRRLRFRTPRIERQRCDAGIYIGQYQRQVGQYQRQVQNFRASNCWCYEHINHVAPKPQRKPRCLVWLLDSSVLPLVLFLIIACMTRNSLKCSSRKCLER